MKEINRHSISILFLTLLIISLFFAKNVFAGLAFNSVGGRITSTFVTGVACGGYGPLTIIGATSRGNYWIPFGVPNNSIPTPGGQFLGLASNIPLGGCWTTTFPSFPYPAYSIINYGTSKF